MLLRSTIGFIEIIIKDVLMKKYCNILYSQCYMTQNVNKSLERITFCPDGEQVTRYLMHSCALGLESSVP